jgi:hypothetical protein
MLVSIYGSGLGPQRGCQGFADPNLPRTARYPRTLCGVQVFVDGVSAGLLWAQEKQINFQMPQAGLPGGSAELKVVFEGREGTARVAIRTDKVELSVEGMARVGGPVWIRVALPYGFPDIRYPVRTDPSDFGCDELEVRQNGVLLPRLRVNTGEMMRNGPLCGTMGIAGYPERFVGRLPLHLQYRFEQPGVYEIRYSRRSQDFRATAPAIQSEWARIEILPTRAEVARAAPQNAGELLADYLPSTLKPGNAAGLEAVLGYLYHPDAAVRQYAAGALGYFPEDVVDGRLAQLVRTKGPADTFVYRVVAKHPELMEAILPYLKSDTRGILQGAVRGVSWLLSKQGDARAENALVDAAPHVLAVGDSQMVSDYAAALGNIRSEGARDLLWSFVERRLALGQSLIAITWRKDPRDLARLGAMIETTPVVDPAYSSLPYALRNGYGEASVPYLEAALERSGSASVRTNCARELIVAGKASGFRFVAQAMEEGSAYKGELVQFVRDRFPELRDAPEPAVLEFVKRLAQ